MIDIIVHGKPVTLSKDTILKTRECKINIELGCIEEVKSGKVYINPDYGIERYEKDCMEEIEKYKSGYYDKWIGFIQLAYWIQTGESIPLLNH